MSNLSDKPMVTTETEIGSNGVGHSNANNKSGVAKVTPEELQLELAIARNQNEQLRAELEKAKASNNSGSDAIKELGNILKEALAPKTVGPTEDDNINRAAQFREKATMIDGASMMEAQSTMLAFRNEEKMPISIPNSFKTILGNSLDITVNGVRVAIPCDGKTYMINKTHAMHARERIAKLDKINSDTTPGVTEINA